MRQRGEDRRCGPGACLDRALITHSLAQAACETPSLFVLCLFALSLAERRPGRLEAGAHRRLWALRGHPRLPTSVFDSLDALEIKSEPWVDCRFVLCGVGLPCVVCEGRRCLHRFGDSGGGTVTGELNAIFPGPSLTLLWLRKCSPGTEGGRACTNKLCPVSGPICIAFLPLLV